jgi:hypothetical protein
MFEGAALENSIASPGKVFSGVLLATTALFLSATLSAGAATPKKQVTIYSVASGVQFINNQDDRQRGATNNPFDADTNKLASKSTDAGNGPFPGDVAVYSFKLFTGPTLTKSAGAASYTCYYNYKQHALCMAYFELKGDTGTLLGSGPINFNSSGFKMVVTGGTKKYLGASGQVVAIPAAKNSQRLNFQLLS